MRRLLPPLVLACTLCALPGAAHATDLRLGADMSWVHDASFDAYWQNDLFSRLDACLAYTVFAATPFRLDAELGYGYAGYLQATVPFASLDTKLYVHDFYAGLRASLAADGVEWVRPYVRVQGGVSLGLASFHDVSTASASTYEDSDVGGLVYGGGGVEIVLPLSVFLDQPPAPLSEPLAFGIYLEGGYFYRTALSFSPTIPGPDDAAADADRIPTRGFSAGDVNLSGGELRLGFLARM
jgi:hypothetical protein